MVLMNGGILGFGNQFEISDIDTVAVKVDLNEVERCRAGLAPSRQYQAAKSFHEPFATINVPGLYLIDRDLYTGFTKEIELKMLSKDEERTYATAMWMWDYLRRSNASGFFLPLSGGIDSAATLALVGVMCIMVMRDFEKLEGYNKDIIRGDLERLCGKIPENAKEMTGILMHTCYMKTSNSTAATQERARVIAADIGSRHLEGDIEELWQGFKTTFMEFSGSDEPKFSAVADVADVAL
jgi:NAD+ synthase (glutamine-hydrolysing)